MAAKTSSSLSPSIQNKQAIWFYQLGLNPDGQVEWERYSDFESDFIEEALRKKEEEISFDDCIINFKKNMQFSKSNKNQCSSIKREEVGENDLIRKERFSFPEEPIEINSFESNFRWNIIRKWSSKNSKIKYRYADVAELAALGILEEGRRLNRNLDAKNLANELRTCIKLNKDQRTHYLDMAVKQCAIYLYSIESFLYRLVNSTLRNNDVSKLDTLGPFCYLLSKYLSSDNLSYLPFTVYRGTSLSEKMIKDYKTAVNRRVVWPAFTSTTKDRQVAEYYSGNAMFIIKVVQFGKKGVRNISSLSKFPQESEVLFCEGHSFTIEKVDFDSERKKHLIYMRI